MKIRIQDNSVRFRITLKELETLQAVGRLESRTEVPSEPGTARQFLYAVCANPAATLSRLRLHPFGMELELSAPDFAVLCLPDQEGVYIRNEWSDGSGTPRRSLAFVEKDRPGSTCEKPEAWIYEEIPGRSRETRPIPAERAED